MNKGNALFYVLLGVVLLAALSYTITRQNVSGGAAQQLSDQQAEIYAAQLINHANVVKAAIDQMLATGSTIDDIDFVRPDEAGYDTAPHIHKVFHPSGGGVEILPKSFTYMNNITNANSGWQYQKGQNVAWTPTTQSDLVYSLLFVSENICEKINKIIHGTEYTPGVTIDFTNTFIYDASNSDFNTGPCPDCVGKESFCFHKNSPTSTTVFYTIVAAR